MNSRPRLTSNESSSNIETVKTKKNKLKGGTNIEINHEYLDETLHINNLWMELAMQNISNDQTVRNNRVQGLKVFNSQFLATQAKKGEQWVFMISAIKKPFDVRGDDIIEFSTENETLKNQLGDYDQKLLGESKAKLLKQIDDEKRTTLFPLRIKTQMKKKH